MGAFSQAKIFSCMVCINSNSARRLPYKENNFFQISYWIRIRIWIQVANHTTVAKV